MITLPGYTFLGVVYEDECIRVLHAYSQPTLRVAAIKMVKEGPRMACENAKLVHVSGLSNKEIAGKLHVTFETVKAHTKNIFAKLQVNRRVQAIIEGRRLNLL